MTILVYPEDAIYGIHDIHSVFMKTLGYPEDVIDDAKRAETLAF